MAPCVADPDQRRRLLRVDHVLVASPGKVDLRQEVIVGFSSTGQPNYQQILEEIREQLARIANALEAQNKKS